MSMTLAELGAEVARVRKERRLSQTDLALAAAVSRQSISLLERGALSDLGVQKVMRVLDALDLELVVRPVGHPVTLDDLRPRSG
jgi:transcriptional regulator with XRE-family HTH domain